MKSLSFDPTNGLCGALFIGVGLFFAYPVARPRYRHGVPHGAGLFPAGAGRRPRSCSALIILVQAFRVEGEPIGPIAWRGMLFILPAPIFFGLTVRGLGFVPSLFLTALIACLRLARA